MGTSTLHAGPGLKDWARMWKMGSAEKARVVKMMLLGKTPLGRVSDEQFPFQADAARRTQWAPRWLRLMVDVFHP